MDKLQNIRLTNTLFGVLVLVYNQIVHKTNLAKEWFGQEISRKQVQHTESSCLVNSELSSRDSLKNLGFYCFRH